MTSISGNTDEFTCWDLYLSGVLKAFNAKPVSTHGKIKSFFHLIHSFCSIPAIVFFS